MHWSLAAFTSVVRRDQDHERWYGILLDQVDILLTQLVIQAFFGQREHKYIISSIPTLFSPITTLTPAPTLPQSPNLPQCQSYRGICHTSKITHISRSHQSHYYSTNRSLLVSLPYFKPKTSPISTQSKPLPNPTLYPTPTPYPHIRPHSGPGPSMRSVAYIALAAMSDPHHHHLGDYLDFNFLLDCHLLQVVWTPECLPLIPGSCLLLIPRHTWRYWWECLHSEARTGRAQRAAPFATRDWASRPVTRTSPRCVPSSQLRCFGIQFGIYRSGRRLALRWLWTEAD